MRLIAEELLCSDILKTLNTVISEPTRDDLEGMLLSLVVIFTQSIQLSNITRGMEPRPALRQLEHCCSRLNPRRPEAQPQVEAGNASREDGGAERDRTVDPLLAKQVLSQLSYSPISISVSDGGS